MPFSRLRSTKPLSSFGAVDADVEVAVRGQQDAIHAALAEMRLGELVRALDAFGAGRRSTGLQFAQRLDDLLLVLHGRRLEHRARGAGVHHDAHGVGRLQARQQQLHRLDRQRQFVGRIHRAAHVEQQHQVGVRRIVARDLVALDADVNQLAALAPGRVANYYRRLERRLRGIRRRPRVVEVVDHLLDAHRILLRQAAGVQLPAHEAVRRGIDVRRERGHRLVGDLLDRVHFELLELVAAFVRNRHRGFVRIVPATVAVGGGETGTVAARTRPEYPLPAGGATPLCGDCWARDARAPVTITSSASPDAAGVGACGARATATAWDTLQRLGNVLLRKLADVFRRDGIDDRHSVALDFHGSLQLRSLARHDDGGQFPVLFQRRA